jgi:hypothetical protein
VGRLLASEQRAVLELGVGSGEVLASPGLARIARSFVATIANIPDNFAERLAARRVHQVAKRAGGTVQF